jgi:ribosome-binding factor A
MPKNKYNILLQHSLAEVLVKERLINNALITISDIVVEDNLKKAIVYISVLPSNLAGSALRAVRKYSKSLAYQASQKIGLRQVPILNWRFDPRAKKAGEIEDLISQISQDN